MFIRKIKNSFRFNLFRVQFKKSVENFARVHAKNGVGRDEEKLFIDYMAFYEEIMASLVRGVNMVFKLDWYDELNGLSDDEIIEKVRNHQKIQENEIKSFKDFFYK